MAQKLRPDLDIGKVAQYCLAHDLVEVYAGDTSTMMISSKDMNAKKAREKASFIKIVNLFGKDFPWITQTIESYEKLDSPEARFVKTLDKIVPKFTHILNGGKYIREKGVTKKDLTQLYLQRQPNIDMAGYAYDQPELMTIRLDLAEEVIKKTYPN